MFNPQFYTATYHTFYINLYEPISFFAFCTIHHTSSVVHTKVASKGEEQIEEDSTRKDDSQKHVKNDFVAR